MTADFDTIWEAILFCCADNEPKDRTDEQIVADMDADQGNALAALSRVEAAAEQAEKSLDDLADEVDAYMLWQPGKWGHAAARKRLSSALSLLRGKDTG